MGQTTVKYATVNDTYVKGESYSMQFEFDFDVTDYTVIAKADNINFTIVPTEPTVEGNISALVISLTPAQTAKLRSRAIWYFEVEKEEIKNLWIKGVLTRE